MRRGAGGKRRDASEAHIVGGLRALGYEVSYVSGYGLPDVLARRVSWPAGLCVGLEIKTLTGRLRPSQGDWPVVRTLDEARAAIGALRGAGVAP